MSSLFACKAERGPTECILGKCLCENMYCAADDGEHCEPQVCLPGASPPTYSPNWWVKLFYAISGVAHFPAPEDLQENMMDYAWILARPSIALVEIGIFIATCTIVCVCCCRGCGILHLRIGDRAKPQPLRQRPAEGGSTDAEDAGRGLVEQDDSQMPTKPWACPLLCMVLFILCFNWLALKIRHRTFSRDVTVIGGELLHAYDDIKVVSHQAHVINQTCINFKEDLLRVPLSCKVDDPLTQAVIKKGTSLADESLANYVDQVTQLYRAVRRLPGIMEACAFVFLDNTKAIVWIPLIPVLLVSCICFLILIEGIAARCFNSSAFADCVDCGLKCASLLFFVVIVITAAIAAVELAVCVTLSVFCMDVDENTLSYVQMAVGGNETDPYSDAYNASRYYIKGDMYNPISSYAEAAEKYISQVTDIYKDLEGELQMVSKLCPGVSQIDLETIGGQAETILGKVRGLLNGTNVYPYYDGIVRKGACLRVVASLGWIVFFQVAMGLICFPVCILMTHYFLVKFAIWKHFVDDEGESSDSEENSEEEEDSSALEEDGLVKDGQVEKDLEVQLPELDPSRRCGAQRAQERGQVQSRSPEAAYGQHQLAPGMAGADR